MSKTNNQKIIKLENKKFKIISLSEPLNENTEVFPGDPKPEKKVFCTFEKDGCRYNIYSIGDHNYHPHGDAPNHQNLQYKNRGFEFWDLNFVFNKACLIDLSESGDSKKIDGIIYLRKITAKHLLPYIDQIKNNSALILRTGYDKYLKLNKKHIPDNIPYMDRSAIKIISKFNKIKVIGTDSLTIDEIGKSYAHRKFKDKLIVECLVNLYSIPEKNRSGFYLQTSPVAIVGATGGPVVAYAYIPLSH
ncbi:cyclase family protein [Candidatus Desantisbacteria bacterium]|nr:cyclase family protein [Candidatus Desantisbacteria bacterium]